MNNEPVAWMAVNELNGSYSTFTNDQKQRLLPHVSQCYGKWIPLYTHPVKELHLSLQKSKQTGELLAVTYTDDEHRIVEVLWQRPPVKELTDEEIRHIQAQCHLKDVGYDGFIMRFARAILRKAQE